LHKLNVLSFADALRAISTRMISGFWCIFTLVLKAYTANLTATLTNELQNVKAIKSIDDLVNQQRVRYGAVSEGSTSKLFEVSGGLVAFYVVAGRRSWLFNRAS